MRLLFVCTGNICRSPTADAVARHRVRTLGLDWHIDSAGTGGWHEGETPDPRTMEAAARRGFDMAGLSARELTTGDFMHFDHLIAMDDGHLRHLRRMSPGGPVGQVSRLLDWSEAHAGQDIPDPYYGGPDGFETVLDLVEAGIDGLIASLGAGGAYPRG